MRPHEMPPVPFQGMYALLRDTLHVYLPSAFSPQWLMVMPSSTLTLAQLSQDPVHAVQDAVSTSVVEEPSAPVSGMMLPFRSRPWRPWAFARRSRVPANHVAAVFGGIQSCRA